MSMDSQRELQRTVCPVRRASMESADGEAMEIRRRKTLEKAEENSPVKDYNLSISPPNSKIQRSNPFEDHFSPDPPFDLDHRSDNPSETMISGEEPKIQDRNRSSTKKSPENLVDRRIKKPIPNGKKRSSTFGSSDFSDTASDNTDQGQFMLNRARDLISADHPKRALDYGLRAVKFFENSSNSNLATSLRGLAAIYTALNQPDQAIAALRRSIQIQEREDQEDQDLDQSIWKFSALMQLGDVYTVADDVDSSIACYSAGLQVQLAALGSDHPRVGATCRFLAEVHVEALQLDAAAGLCKTALNIHRGRGEEEMADRTLLGLICEINGEHEAALEHLTVARAATRAEEVADVDCAIGDACLALARYEEAAGAYRRAMGAGRRARGLGRLAGLRARTGHVAEARGLAELAARQYGREGGDMAGGLAELAAVYVAAGVAAEGVRLLRWAVRACEGGPIAVAGLEAQLGVVLYWAGEFGEARDVLESAVGKMGRGGRVPVVLALALNQLGLACAQLSEVAAAARAFARARAIMERVRGPCHPETLDICGNLAATYDAMGRWEEAAQILEHVVSVREEKAGTANTEVEGERRRLGELLKLCGRVWNRKPLTLNTLFAQDPTELHNPKSTCI
ncbi:protein KINESIN LIGHT CHAIN-RELATED 1-like isoform X2 [Wolffia australiana]